ncbi:MAG: hypothetical protein OHK006_13610 [Thermodesulfovibrionales bacterium]
MRRFLSALLLAALAMLPSSAAAADAASALKIDRIMLYFENQRADATVGRAGQRLRAYADIRYTGSGMLEGIWEVDGRVLSQVNQHITGGRSVTIQVPKSPGLPTMDPGTHILRFVPATPTAGLPVPSILYFVLPKDAKRTRAMVKPLSPEDGAELNYGSVTFSWEQSDDADVYLIAFFEKPGGKPVYSAYVREAVFELGGPTLHVLFSSGKKYFWKVTGYDVGKHAVSDQQIQGFSFRK